MVKISLATLSMLFCFSLFAEELTEEQKKAVDSMADGDILLFAISDEGQIDKSWGMVPQVMAIGEGLQLVLSPISGNGQVGESIDYLGTMGEEDASLDLKVPDDCFFGQNKAGLREVLILCATQKSGSEIARWVLNTMKQEAREADEADKKEVFERIEARKAALRANQNKIDGFILGMDGAITGSDNFAMFVEGERAAVKSKRQNRRTVEQEEDEDTQQNSFSHSSALENPAEQDAEQGDSDTHLEPEWDSRVPALGDTVVIPPELAGKPSGKGTSARSGGRR